MNIQTCFERTYLSNAQIRNHTQQILNFFPTWPKDSPITLRGGACCPKIGLTLPKVSMYMYMLNPNDFINLPSVQDRAVRRCWTTESILRAALAIKIATSACGIVRCAASAIYRRWFCHTNCGAVGIYILTTCTAVSNGRTTVWKLAFLLAW
jgi:hypothetical protein